MFELHHLSALEQLDWLRRGEGHPARTRRALPRPHRPAERRAGCVRDGHAPSGPWSAADAVAGTPKAATALGSAARRQGPRSPAPACAPRSDRGSSPTTCQRSPTNSPLVLDAAGAVSLGKTNTPEFGLPSYTEPLAGRARPQPVRPRARAGRIQRGSGGRRGRRTAAARAGLGRRRLDPHPGRGDRPGRPEAVTRARSRPASGFASLAGLVGAGPLARTVADAALLLDAPWSATPRTATPPRRPPGTGARSSTPRSAARGGSSSA